MKNNDYHLNAVNDKHDSEISKKEGTEDNITELIYNRSELYGYVSNNKFYYMGDNARKKLSSIKLIKDNKLHIAKSFNNRIIFMIQRTAGCNYGDIYTMKYHNAPELVAQKVLLFSYNNDQDYVTFIVKSKQCSDKYKLYATTGEKIFKISDNFNYSSTELPVGEEWK